MLAGGANAEALLVLKVTTAPPDGAAPLRVTVIVALFVLITVEGLTDTEVNVGGAIVYVAEATELSAQLVSYAMACKVCVLLTVIPPL
jgi:hypothetical protein